MRLTRFLLYFLLLASCSHKDLITETTIPEDGLSKLLQGNTLFRIDSPKGKISSLQNSQLPFAIVITCSDSRVSPELIFHQGLGDLFVIRTAGNIIGDYELGSVEYALESFQTNLIVVLGHENCGAVTAYVNGDHELKGNIKTIVDYIGNEEEEISLSEEDRHSLAKSVNANIRHAVNVLRKSEPIIGDRLRNNKIRIIGALYHMSDGRVEIIDENNP
ncbi:MAG TPA: carbonic anhydrase [Cyclobacteriaceae bacterium]